MTHDARRRSRHVVRVREAAAPARRRARAPRCNRRRRPSPRAHGRTVVRSEQVELEEARVRHLLARRARTPSALSSMPASSAAGHSARSDASRSPWPLPMSRTRAGRRPAAIASMIRLAAVCLRRVVAGGVRVLGPVRLPVVDGRIVDVRHRTGDAPPRIRSAASARLATTWSRRRPKLLVVAVVDEDRLHAGRGDRRRCRASDRRR